MRSFYLGDMSNKTAIRAMMDGSEYTQFKQIAEALDMPETSLRSTLNRNTLRVNDLQRIADLLGYKITFEKEQKE